MDATASAKLNQEVATLQSTIGTNQSDTQVAISSIRNTLSDNKAVLEQDIASLSNTITTLQQDVNSKYDELSRQINNNKSALEQALRETQEELNNNLSNNKKQTDSSIADLGKSKAEITYSLENGVPTLTISNVQKK